MEADFNLLTLGAVFIWLGILTCFNIWAFIYYKRLTQGVGKKSLFSILEKLAKEQKLEAEKAIGLTQRVKKIEGDIVAHVQKVGLVRFNPFAETGGNQSFCLALLDGDDNGLIISSLHSRDSTRVYAKPVKKGKETGFTFSEEEKKAIKGAKKIK